MIGWITEALRLRASDRLLASWRMQRKSDEFFSTQPLSQLRRNKAGAFIRARILLARERMAR